MFSRHLYKVSRRKAMQIEIGYGRTAYTVKKKKEEIIFGIGRDLMWSTFGKHFPHNHEIARLNSLPQVLMNIPTSQPNALICFPHWRVFSNISKSLCLPPPTLKRKKYSVFYTDFFFRTIFHSPPPQNRLRRIIRHKYIHRAPQFRTSPASKKALFLPYR